ncbi:MAG: hypothetical protein ACREM3_18825 [Candidatus Rokuibacteriota bacterium]
MADTQVHLEVEDWVRREWMQRKFGQLFSRERVKLSSGGVCDFDAVSGDGGIVAAVSTSGALTAGSKNAGGKMLKIRSDMYFLLLAEAERRIVVLTEKDMHRCMKELEAGRVPRSIEFVNVEIPSDLELKLRSSRNKAFDEVLPRRDAQP